MNRARIERSLEQKSSSDPTRRTKTRTRPTVSDRRGAPDSTRRTKTRTVQPSRTEEMHPAQSVERRAYVQPCQNLGRVGRPRSVSTQPDGHPTRPYTGPKICTTGSTTLYALTI
jgi:hypothetical protein